MVVSWKDVKAGLSADERAEVERDGQAMAAEYRSLQQLRKARRLSQKDLAEKLQTNQAGVSKIEKRTDLMLSTLRGYVEAAGGTLELVARFPDAPPVRIDHLGSIGRAESVEPAE